MKSGESEMRERAKASADERFATKHKAQRASDGPSVPPSQTPQPGGAEGDDHEEELIDEGLEESFPASDPLAVPVPPKTRPDAGGGHA